MSVFLLKRLATFVATLVAASVVIFLVLEILPGDAAQMMMGPDASPEAVRALAVKFGLDRPPLERYLGWVGGMLAGELGLSHAYSSPVSELIAERLLVTVPLALMAMALTTVLALQCRRLCCVAPQPARRRRADGPEPARHRDPELLVRDPADPAVLGHAALVLGGRLSWLERGLLAGVQVAAAAGRVAGRGAGGHPVAHHALGGAGSAARRLRAHRPRQGPVAPRRRCGATCCATR